MSLLDTWTKLFSNFQWQNRPSTSTPLGRSKLQLLNNAIDGIDDRVLDLKDGVDDITTALDDKVDKVAGKGLSTNDFDNTYKDKLDGISEQANKVEITPVVTEGTTLATISIDGVDTDIKGSDIDVDDELKPDSTNPVENKVIYSALNDLLPEETAEGNPISITDASGLNAKFCEVSFSPIQSGSGEPSPQNIRPISGRDSLVLNQTGANQWDEITEFGGIDNTNGQKTASTTSIRTKNYISVFPATEYYIIAPAYLYYAEYDSNKTFVRGGSIGGSRVFTTNSATHYMMFSISSSYGTTYKNDVGVNLPSTITDYEPFKGLTTHTATFPDTVYGGSHEFVSGKAKSEWGYIASYNGETITEPWISDRDVYVAGTTPSTGAEVCYKLETPQEITLTPETIELLKGNNTLFTDGDNITLKYSADIKQWVLAQLNS